MKANRVIRSLITCLIILSFTPFIQGGCGGGGGSSGGSDITPENTGGSDITPETNVGRTIQLNVVMGPIVGANVSVSSLDNPDLVITSGTTEDSTDLSEAGRVTLQIPPEYDDTPLWVRSSGGEDIDADDDGVRDEVPTPNNINLEFAVPTPAELEGLRVVANPLLSYAVPYVTGSFWYDSNLTSFPEAVRTVMRRVARSLIREDIDGDGTVGWEDLVSFHPLTDQDKCRIPWGYVLNNIDRWRRGYIAELEVVYSRWFYLEPFTLEPYDSDGDGEWKNERDSHNNYRIMFTTDKDGYTIQDLLDGQDVRGGKVTLPDNSKITYTWAGEDRHAEMWLVEDDAEPPLWVGQWGVETGSSGPITADVGGAIIDPMEAPVGEYIINYATGDGQEHRESVYLFENRDDPLIYPIPEIVVDEDGFIESISLRFEDEMGNLLEDPPLLKTGVGIHMWDNVGPVNRLVREPGFYVPVAGSENTQHMIYLGNISMTSPTTPFTPTNNGHKIYFEDAWAIGCGYTGGDGVDREFHFMNSNLDLYPKLKALPSWAEGKIELQYSPSAITGREVVSIRYKFDTWDVWEEEQGSSVTIVAPDGASTIYFTAKDTSRFYLYPPHQWALTQ